MNDRKRRMPEFAEKPEKIELDNGGTLFRLENEEGKIKTCYRIRNLSDELCREHHLSVIESGEKRGQKHIEWQAEKSNSSWKSEIRKDINSAIRDSSIYEEFLQILTAKGYEIKGKSLETNAAKYISFPSMNRERFVRGSAKFILRKE